MKENLATGGGNPSRFKGCHSGTACYQTPALTVHILLTENGFAGSSSCEDVSIEKMYDWDAWE